jgi:hypothetical protein
VLGGFQILGTSAAGQLHLRDQLPRDDAFVIRSCGSWLAIAVADGLGSHHLSRFGATLAADWLASQLLSGLPDQVFPHGIASSVPLDAVPPPWPQAPELSVAFAGSVGTLTWHATSLSAGGANPSAVAMPGQQGEPGDAQPPADPNQVEQPLAGGNGATAPDASGERGEPSAAERAAAEAAPASDPGSPDPSTAPLDRQPVTGTPTASSSSAAPAAQPVADRDSGQEPLPWLDLENIVRHAFEATRGALANRAGQVGLPLRDLGCTLLGVLLDTDSGACAVGQIGDGTILGRAADGRTGPILDVPDTGDAASVYPLTHPQWQRYFRVERTAASAIAGGILVMTDGVANDCVAGVPAAALATWVDRLIEQVRASEGPGGSSRLLRWLASYRRPDSFDDRTLVMLYR